MGWASTEFETIDLGDARRNKRAIRLVERLSAQPMASVPQACGDWADTMAAYRFFYNEAVDWRAILGAHTDCAKTRWQRWRRKVSPAHGGSTVASQGEVALQNQRIHR